MKEEAAGIAELCSELTAVNEEWAAGGGAYSLVSETASAPESGEFANAVPGQALVSESESGTETHGGAVHEHSSGPGLCSATGEDGGAAAEEAPGRKPYFCGPLKLQDDG